MIVISNQLMINEQEIELNAIRAQSTGGQHINQLCYRYERYRIVSHLYA